MKFGWKDATVSVEEMRSVRTGAGGGDTVGGCKSAEMRVVLYHLPRVNLVF